MMLMNNVPRTGQGKLSKDREKKIINNKSLSTEFACALDMMACDALARMTCLGRYAIPCSLDRRQME